MNNIATRQICILGVLFLLVIPIRAQLLDHVLGEVLVQIAPEADIRRVAAQLQAHAGNRTDFRIHRRLRGPFEIWVCKFDYVKINERHLLDRLRRQPDVLNAQFNHFLSRRNTIPDDPQFDRQWQYLNTGQSGGVEGADLDMELAWDITTGGLTASNDTIVVCVIDDGIDPTHLDLRENRWYNYAEIPDNGFDDDGNGFIDDYLGWNTATNDDDVEIDDFHGTPIAGIIGAVGNNGRGVAGINWRIKIMTVVGGTGLESEALEAYSYPLTFRKKYNDSNGREGAFVVATNASWGVDRARPDEFPLWCAYYDTLGAAGILNIAATVNENIDVEEVGDMPTTCTSDFLIGVTNLNDRGRKVMEAGFGPESIDLGAYGELVWTTAFGNKYGEFDGTSAAAPHVTGAVALLYSAPCPTIMALAQSDPAAAARLMRQYILAGVVPEPTLEGKTVTGGTLNIFNSLQVLLDNCGDCPPPTSLTAVNRRDTEVTLQWNVNDSINRTDLRWRRTGSNSWQVVQNVSSPFLLDGLTGCTEYEFQLRAYCRTETLDWSASLVFQSEGCCERPANFRLTSVNDRTAVFQWAPVFAAQEYNVRWRPEGETDWQTQTTSQTTAFLNNLGACLRYEAQIRTVCAPGPTEYGEGLIFQTTGCGACLDLAYCLPDNADASAEWISEVCINTLEHFSGPDDGYGDYTGLPSTQLEIGASYPLRLEQAFADESFPEYFQVWIDLNQDGKFSEEEKVYDAGGASREPVEGTIEIPEDALPGNTRLRVAMKFLGPGGPCSFVDRPFGEIQDYCVRIVESETICDSPADMDTTLVERARIDLRWEDQSGSSEYQLRYRPIEEKDWEEISVTGTQTSLLLLESCTEYEVRIKSICGDNPGKFSEALLVQTDCPTSTVAVPHVIKSFRLFPNPFRSRLRMDLHLREKQEALQILLFDSSGKRIHHQTHSLPAGDNLLQLSPQGVPAGVYWLQLITDQGQSRVERVLYSPR